MATDAVTAAVPEIAGGCVAVQVGTAVAPVGPVTVQVSATVPVYPLLGVMVTGTFADCPGAPIVVEVPLSVRANVGSVADPCAA